MSRLYVNGKEIEVDGKRRLMDVLRKDCHLKSVKDGCSQGACGTCTVVVDGKTVKSCVQTADKFEGKQAKAYMLNPMGFSIPLTKEMIPKLMKKFGLEGDQK